MLRGDARRGAADEAPTAPHATAPVDAHKPGGPARFWDRRRLRLVLVLSSLLSLIVHAIVTPYDLVPDRNAIELKDVDGELGIPVDLLGEEVPEPPPPPPTVAPEPTPTDPNASLPAKTRDAGVPKKEPVDAGAPLAKPRDAGGDVLDGSVPTDGGEGDGGASDGGELVASADAGASGGGQGPSDPGSMIGMRGLLAAGEINVTLLVNVAVIRKDPIGARLGPVLTSLPQWRDFLKGSQAAIEPIRDTDWILIYGPSLIHTDRDAVIVHYNVPDAVVDRAVDVIAQSYDRGGPFDAGVPGVRASIGHADNAERVFLRVQPQVLVVVPKKNAVDFAKAMRRAPISPKVRPGEAMRLVVKDPWKQVAIPGLRFSQSVKEIRMWIVPTASGTADVFLEGDTTDEASAVQTAADLTEVLRRQNAGFVRIVTRGLLNDAKVEAEGTRMKLVIHATPEQMKAVFNAVAAMTGAQVEPIP